MEPFDLYYKSTLSTNRLSASSAGVRIFFDSPPADLFLKFETLNICFLDAEWVFM